MAQTRPNTRRSIEAKIVADLLNLTMLVLASVGALAFGVLAAYAILRVGFALMGVRSRTAMPVKIRPEVAHIS
jgi:ABC-type glycerol-3-phosphate transport system permease component